MIQKQNEATPARPEGSRPLEADYILLSFEERIAQLQSEKAWQQGDRNAITLVHHPRLRVVLIALKEGSVMDTHTADGPVTIQALEGQLEVAVREKTFALQAGQSLMLNDQVPHSVKGTTEAAFLLTMGPGVEKTF